MGVEDDRERIGADKLEAEGLYVERTGRSGIARGDEGDEVGSGKHWSSGRFKSGLPPDGRRQILEVSNHNSTAILATIVG